MQSTDSDGDNTTGASFWEPHQYSRTVKRFENSNKLCSELALMIQERSDIEKAYAANLRKFASRLDAFIKSGLEYGTGSKILSGLVKEAEDNAELHANIAAGLISPVQSSIKNWQKENFHKSSISTTIKEVKTLDSEFENAQKTWYKNYKQVNRCKKEYFHACKLVRSLQVQVQNARNEPFGTPEQLRKMEDKLKKATGEEEKTRKSYEDALSNLSDVTPRYMEDMTQVFNKAQSFERDRINFFKQQALQMQEVLDVSSKPSLSQIFLDLKDTISKVDADADLKKWSLAHGVDMPTNFPTFQEYSPELCAIGKKGKSTLADGNTGVTLTGVKPINSPERPAWPDSASNLSTSSPGHTAGYGSASMNGGGNGSTERTENTTGGGAPATATYAEFVDDGRPGVPIRALYDYVGVEADELSFNTGDLFEKLEDEDEQGWCKGRKDGRVGLYPANYVEVV